MLNSNFIALVLLILFAVIIFYVIIPSLIKILLRYNFLQKISKKENVYLTFDDGPDEYSTPEILNVLKEFGVKATFFLQGKNAEKNPGIVKKIITEGHKIGEHSYHHTHAWKSGPFKTAFDLIKGNRILKNIHDGNSTHLLRPPFGKLNLISVIYIWLFNKRVIFWNIDPKDYINSPAYVAEYVIKRIQSGSVVLLHDARRNNNHDANSTVNALKTILDKTKNLGLRFSSIDC